MCVVEDGRQEGGRERNANKHKGRNGRYDVGLTSKEGRGVLRVEVLRSFGGTKRVTTRGCQFQERPVRHHELRKNNFLTYLSIPVDFERRETNEVPNTRFVISRGRSRIGFSHGQGSLTVVKFERNDDKDRQRLLFSLPLVRTLVRTRH